MFNSIRIALFHSLTLTQLITKLVVLSLATLLYISSIKGLLQTKELLFWRMTNISVPFYYKIIAHTRKFYDKISQVVIENTFLPSIENMYNVQSKWIIIMAVYQTIIFLVYIKHTFSNRKHYILLFFLNLILIVFATLFYWDLLILPFFGPILTKFWFTTMGLPDYYTTLQDYSSTLKDFVNIKLPLFYHEFQELVGCSKLYYHRPSYATFDWHKVNWFTLDPQNIYGFHNVKTSDVGYKLKDDNMKLQTPDLQTTHMYMNNLPLWTEVYNITYITKYPYNSVSDFSLLHVIHGYHRYSLGLSLACIIFVITLILTLQYSLNFLTSLSNKDSEKLSPYECGFDPMHSNARIKFDVLYWIIGILYLIFDLEIIFIFPLATILHTLTNPIALLAYLFFMIILTLGFIYEWKKGALKLNL